MRILLRVMLALFLTLFTTVSQAAAAAPPLVFTKYFDKTEGAFFVLVPKGWITQGGMVRVNPLAAQGGVGNATEAKIDFAVAKDASGKVQIRWIPKINYARPAAGSYS